MRVSPAQSKPQAHDSKSIFEEYPPNSFFKNSYRVTISWATDINRWLDIPARIVMESLENPTKFAKTVRKLIRELFGDINYMQNASNSFKLFINDCNL